MEVKKNQFPARKGALYNNKLDRKKNGTIRAGLQNEMGRQKVEKKSKTWVALFSRLSFCFACYVTATANETNRSIFDQPQLLDLVLSSLPIEVYPAIPDRFSNEYHHFLPEYPGFHGFYHFLVNELSTTKFLLFFLSFFSRTFNQLHPQSSEHTSLVVT